ncbi:MAG: site-2 protease family protein [Candidatus Odinarchaeia archaeon]
MDGDKRLDLNQLTKLVSLFFDIKEVYVSESSVTCFIISSTPDLKNSFKALYNLLRVYNLIPILRYYQNARITTYREVISNLGESQKELTLRIIAKKNEAGKKRNKLNLILFIATLFTTWLTGYFYGIDPAFQEVYPEAHPIYISIAFTLALIGIVGLHEVGHIILMRKHRIEASPPYFIPGIPILGLPTFGAIIFQRSPPSTRDELFDMGISGPLLGFLFSFIITVIGILMSKIISLDFANYLQSKYPSIGTIPVPLLFTLLQTIFQQESGVLYIHPVAYAGWLGFLITGLNLFPIGQLDGGHAARAVLGERKATYLSYISVVIMSVLGFFAMAILIFLLGGFKHPGPLDDVSKVDFKRRVIWIFSIVLLILSIPPFIILMF